MTELVSQQQIFRLFPNFYPSFSFLPLVFIILVCFRENPLWTRTITTSGAWLEIIIHASTATSSRNFTLFQKAKWAGCAKVAFSSLDDSVKVASDCNLNSNIHRAEEWLIWFAKNILLEEDNGKLDEFQRFIFGVTTLTVPFSRDIWK